MSKIRTRFAPSPTGRMHVGNLRTALYEYLIARHEHGTFVLRIEDTDQERFVPEALDIIYNTMKLTGLQHDEGPDKDGGYGPYVQSERMKTGVYLDYAKQLVEKGEAYYCFCTKERLEEMARKLQNMISIVCIFPKKKFRQSLTQGFLTLFVKTIRQREQRPFMMPFTAILR